MYYAVSGEIEKYFIENSWNDYALPVYVVQAANEKTGNLVVWFHPEGKENLLDNPLAAELFQAGHTLIAADLPGTGELHDPEFTGDGVIQGIPFNYTFGANLAGKSIPGIQAEAIDLLMQFAEKTFPGKTTEAVVEGNAAPAFLHFAVLKNPFSKITFHEFPGKLEELTKQEYYDPGVAFTIVPGSLSHYDLPDLTGYLENAGTSVVFKNMTTYIPDSEDYPF